MKRIMVGICFLLLTMIMIEVPKVEANEVMDAIAADEDGQIEFEFFNLDENLTDVNSYPVRVRLEGLHTDQAYIRMIWDLDVRELDEVFPISIHEDMNAPVYVLPNGDTYMASGRIEFEGVSQEMFGGHLYLTNLPSQSGIQLMMADYVNNEQGQKKYHWMLTETDDVAGSHVEDVARDIYDLDERVLAWTQEVGGKFYRIYPPNKAELDHSGLTFDELMNYMTLDGLAVNPLETPGYTLHAVYSTAIQGVDHEEYITYLMLEFQGQAQVWVSTQSSTDNLVNFHLTENAQMRQLFEDWFYSAN